MKLYLATANAHKLGELRELFAHANIDFHVIGSDEIGGMPPCEETGKTFEANARIKLRALKDSSPYLPEASFLSDDSGLSVQALSGAPGVLSARYAGDNATDQQNVEKLLDALKDKLPSERVARFQCCLLLDHPAWGEVVFHSIIKGTLSETSRGDQGFGYDPIFIPEGYDKTFAELGPTIKNQISHRARALKQMVSWLQSF